MNMPTATLTQNHQFEAAYARLAPILAERTPFRYLERIGETFGAAALAPTNDFLARIATYKTEGGWVVIGGALRAQLNRAICRGHLSALECISSPRMCGMAPISSGNESQARGWWPTSRARCASCAGGERIPIVGCAAP